MKGIMRGRVQAADSYVSKVTKEEVGQVHVASGKSMIKVGCADWQEFSEDELVVVVGTFKAWGDSISCSEGVVIRLTPAVLANLEGIEAAAEGVGGHDVV